MYTDKKEDRNDYRTYWMGCLLRELLEGLSSDDIDECWPRDEDEFIQDLKNKGWVVDEDGEVYCCEACMKEKKEDENE